MNARQYYNARSTRRRLLAEGDGIRNTHNFVKAVLIAEYVPAASHILDLGCGQGGDLLKFKRRSPKSYRGIDISHTAIEALSKRIAHIKMRCRVKLECFDFSERSWAADPKLDVVSCQFAIQYAFSSPTHAEHVFRCISAALKNGGVFIGTVPVHPDLSYHAVIVRLPDDSRECAEFSAQRDDILDLCVRNGLRLELWQGFTEYYLEKVEQYGELVAAMRAKHLPDSNNAVFAFRKTGI